MPFVFLDHETEKQFSQTDSLTLDDLWTDFAAAEAIYEGNGHFAWGEEEVELSYSLHRPRPVSEYELELAWETRNMPLL